MALALLDKAGIPAGTPDELRHAFVSFDYRYCALTLDNCQSYIVDLQQKRYLHYPQASAAGFDGYTAMMSPDEVRFNLFSWEDDIPVDVRAEWHPWIASGA
jgi:hypothetical protein